MATQTESDASGDSAARILCAEGDNRLRQVIVEELTNAGYHVVEAADCDEALAEIAAAPPDLILCDIDMPPGDGYCVLAAVRQDRQEFAETPFVLLIGPSALHDAVKGINHGADDYLAKPVNFELLRVTVNARLRQVSRIREKIRHEIADGRNAVHDRLGRRRCENLNVAARALAPVTPGVILVDDEARVLLANRAARRMTDGVLHLDEGRPPQPLNVEDERRLRHALRQYQSDYGGEAERVECLRLARAWGQRDLMAMIYPLSSVEHDSGVTSGPEPAPDPSVLILLSDPERRNKLSGELLARFFNFTPTETRIAMALAEGRSTAEIADWLGVSGTTVAFHLRNLFEKTDTHRQAELVSLVLAGCITIAPESP